MRTSFLRGGRARWALALVGLIVAGFGLAQPAAGEWVLARLTDERGTLAFAVPGPEVPTLRLTGERASGSTGCNTFMGSVALGETAARFSPLATTRRACPGELAGVEARYLAGLAEVRGLSLGGGELTLSGAGVRLVFRRAGASGAAGTVPVRLIADWRLVGTIGDDPPTLRLGADGRASGSTGCNSFSGPYTVTGDAIRLGPLAVTLRACASEELNRQERDYLQRLAAVRTFTTVGNLLTLTTEDGTRLEFQRPVNGG